MVDKNGPFCYNVYTVNN